MLDSELDEIIYNILISRINSENCISELINEDLVEDLVIVSKSIFDDELILLKLESPIQIVGDLHGNIDDLIRIFERCGYPPDSSYLFLGDYVDRGPNSVEVMLLLLALKCKYPNHINLLRGNHENASMSLTYGFYHECVKKYNQNIFNLFSSLFPFLPIAAIVSESIFCVHGGVSPKINSLNDFSRMSKPKILCGDNIFTDLVWSDPSDFLEAGCLSNPRGLGVCFSHKCLVSFLDQNGLEILIRSHEECKNGFRRSFDDQRCLTIFSNTNYCGHSNSATIAKISKDKSLLHESFDPLSAEDLKKRRIIWPYWLLEKKEIYPLVSSSDELITDLIDKSVPYVL